jgi:hypothetical protein
LEVEYLIKEDVLRWLINLEKECAICQYTLSPGQIEAIWENFGGSCAEISRFLGDILMGAEDGSMPDAVFDKVMQRKRIQMRSQFVDYAGLHKDKRSLLRAINSVARADTGRLQEAELALLADEGICDVQGLRNELGSLVRQNFLAYNPVTAEFSLGPEYGDRPVYVR